MKKLFTVIFILLSINSFADVNERFVGEWTVFIVPWEPVSIDEETIDAGTIEFFSDGTCIIKNESSKEYSWETEGIFLFINRSGYTFVIDKEDIILCPAFDDEYTKYLYLRKVDE